MPTWKEYMKQQEEYAQQFPQHIGNLAAKAEKEKEKEEKEKKEKQHDQIHPQ